MKDRSGMPNPSQRRYSPELKERAVRMVLAFRAEFHLSDTGSQQSGGEEVADVVEADLFESSQAGVAGRSAGGPAPPVAYLIGNRQHGRATSRRERYHEGISDAEAARRASQTGSVSV